MSFEINYELRSGYVFLTVEGMISERNLVELAVRIKRICHDSKMQGVVIDAQGIQGALSAAQLFFATQSFFEELGTTVKVAYINPPAHWNAADDELSRNVAKNRGGSLEVFDSESQAVTWLSQQTK